MADYRVGRDPRTGGDRRWRTAVAASSRLPRRCSRPGAACALPRGRSTLAGKRRTPARGLRTRPGRTLVDGGVYDNLGLETAWKSCKTVLVSDGGGAIQARRRARLGAVRRAGAGATGATQMAAGDRNGDRQPGPEPAQTADRSPAYQARRKTAERAPARRLLGDPQRRRQLSSCPGAAWKRRCDETTRSWPAVPTGLARARSGEPQERLINWGYAICDTAMRKWVDDRRCRPPPGFPYPQPARSSG